MVHVVFWEVGEVRVIESMKGLMGGMLKVFLGNYKYVELEGVDLFLY